MQSFAVLPTGSETGLVQHDFIDYDSNLLAIWAGVPSHDQAVRILAKLDDFACAHPRATWVSQVRSPVAARGCCTRGVGVLVTAAVGAC